MAVLVTGGAGYIGSHTCVELLENNKEVVVLDNLSNSSEEALNRVKRITGKEVKFYKGDISDIVILDTIFKKENIESCIHFAGLKSVGESVAKPLEYYQNNIAGTLILLQKLREYNVKNIIFSSSATVYGDPAFVPITEECPKGLCTNPYGWSKSMLEQILMDIYKADETWNIILLRYFNPIGAHKSGLMGENPNGIPNNLMPYVTQVAVGKLCNLCPCRILAITGSDGKTTTSTITAELLRAQGYTVHLGGNIGTPLFDRIADIRPDDFAVLELSSFQLHSMHCAPDVAIITNISPNHLDVHPDFEDYVSAKCSIYRGQRPDGVLVLNARDAHTPRFAAEAPGSVRYFSSIGPVENGVYCSDGVIYRAHGDGNDFAR